MRPFFSYYGSKWIGATRYGPPRRGRVIEPFAGSACYSLRHDCENVRLFDVNPDVCAVWDYLIHCSERDIRALPDAFLSTEECLALPDGPRQLCWWNINYGEGGKRMRKSLREWYLHYVNTGERIGRLAHPKNRGDHFWGAKRKQLIIEQKPLIVKWSIEQCSYDSIPNEDAHWHIDPPYQGKAGNEYEHRGIDYAHLAQWCRERTGAVDVCEQDGADWLDFEPLYLLHAQANGSPSREVVWRKGLDVLPLG